MRVLAAGITVGMTLLGWTTSGACAETVSEVFDRVYRSVVVVRTVERDISVEQQPTRVTGLGSGFLISRDGRILTAAHLVHAASEVKVEFWDGRQAPARIVSSAPGADVALIQIDQVPPGASIAILADSDGARIGDQVMIVGAPYGFTHTLTVGHLSGRQRSGQIAGRFAPVELLQTDAAVNQGNSGGPMFNMSGEVLGIVSHIVSKSGGFEGLGFVVASNAARELLLEHASVWHGIDGMMLSGDLQKIFNLPEPGVLIQRVVENSFAARLGLKGGFVRATIGDRTLIVGGDVVLKVQGMSVGEAHRMRNVLGGLRSGEELTLTVLREGQLKELRMVVP